MCAIPPAQFGISKMSVTSRYLERRYQALKAEFAATGDDVVKWKLNEFRDRLIAYYEYRIVECDREIAQLDDTL